MSYDSVQSLTDRAFRRRFGEGKKYAMVEVTVTGKVHCTKNVLGTEFGREVTYSTDYFLADGVLMSIERDRTGHASSKGPAYYDHMRVMFPMQRGVTSNVRNFAKRMGGKGALKVSKVTSNMGGMSWEPASRKLSAAIK